MPYEFQFYETLRGSFILVFFLHVFFAESVMNDTPQIRGIHGRPVHRPRCVGVLGVVGVVGVVGVYY